MTAGGSPLASGAPGESMRVLMVCNEWLPRHGGLPRFNKDLAAALAKENHAVSSIALNTLDKDHEDARAHGVAWSPAEGKRLVMPELAHLTMTAESHHGAHRPREVPRFGGLGR